MAALFFEGRTGGNRNRWPQESLDGFELNSAFARKVTSDPFVARERESLSDTYFAPYVGGESENTPGSSPGPA